MASSSIYVCDSCGNEFSKWAGQCPACNSWNSLKELKLDITPTTQKSKNRNRSIKETYTPKQALKENKDSITETKISELDRVLGKGITKGGIYLIAGQPGIGKSTLLTQLAHKLAGSQKVTYICSEENAAQVATRVVRLKGDDSKINLLETSITEDILDHAQKHTPDLLIVDSIQSIYSDSLNTAPGSLTQIRKVSHQLITLGKSLSIPVIIVGHVTKEGKLAGPKHLEHMVDVVLEIEGDRNHDLRLLRGLKNRFGPTDETGLFQMTGLGLREVKNPGKLFLNEESQNQPGSALTLVMEGTRPLLVEVQALTVPTDLAFPRRVAQGIPINKLQLICAILTKHTNLKLNTKDVFLNVTGGLKLTDPAADLAIALAILSSYKNKPLPKNSISFGELGLLGEVRPIAYGEKRLKEAKTLGYKTPHNPTTTKSLARIKL